MKVLSVVVHKLWHRLKFLSTDNDNTTADPDDADTSDDDDDAGAMTIVLRTFVTANY